MTLKKLMLVLGTVLLCFSSCEKLKKKAALFKDDIPVIECNGEYLYLADIENILPQNLSREDSTSYVDNYIKKWAIRNLMYDMASKNVSNVEEIEQLVADYRKSLFIHRYQQELIDQRVKDPTDAEVLEYYNANPDMFKLEKPIITGLFMKIPKNAPKIEELKSWLSNQTDENLNKIDKYSLQNAASYQYFGDKWVVYEDIINKMPIENKRNLLYRRLIQAEDEGFIYFLYINKVNDVGAIEPIELARDKIKVLLTNTKKNKYINDFEDDLYEKALKKGTVEHFK